MDVTRDEAKIEALETAVINGNRRKLRVALRRPGIQPSEVTLTDRDGNRVTLLHLAAQLGRAEMVAKLLAAGLSVEGHPGASYTPLMMAAQKGHAETVRELLAAGADPLVRHKDETGFTALHQAAACGRGECVAELLPVTTPNITDKRNCTPVHRASKMGHIGVLRQLWAAGWDMSVVDNNRWSALHHAAALSCVATVEFLVQEVGLSPTQQDKFGYTPADLARSVGNLEVEGWLLKHCGAAAVAAAAPLSLLTKQYKHTYTGIYRRFFADMTDNKLDTIRGTINQTADGHLRNKAGATFLHVAAAQGHTEAAWVLTKDCGVHHHVVTHNHLTPADLAARAGHHETLQLLRDHQCRKGNSLPDRELQQLYQQLLQLIIAGDDVVQASSLLCAGAPLEAVGTVPTDALTLAIRCGRSRLVSLLLAAGASLTSTWQGCNLLLLAWTCANPSPSVACHVTKSFRDVLQLESGRAPETLTAGLHSLRATLEGDCPWRACWPPGQSQQELSRLLLEAVTANCPLTASFLTEAGASPLLRGPSGSTILHEALSHQHNHLREARVREHMTETLVRDLGACLYLPDQRGRLPTRLMNPQLCHRLEKKVYEKERRKLEELKEKCKSKREQRNIVSTLCLQQLLHERTQLPEQLRQYVVEAALVAARLGLQQLMWLLVQHARVAADAVVEPATDATALHQAAAHGRDECVAVLLSLGADPSRCDRYGHSPAHLSAMFGHDSTTRLLRQVWSRRSVQNLSSKLPTITRPPATTTTTQMQQHYQQYLQLYRRLSAGDQSGIRGHEDQDEDAATHRILQTIRVQDLLIQTRQVTVKFEGEAETVRSVVRQELEVLMTRVAQVDPTYRGHLELVGSSSDGTKLFAPDEFDYNLVLDAAKTVRVEVEDNSPAKYYKGRLRLNVQTDDAGLRGNSFMNNLYDAMKEILSTHMLGDARLSLVPPGLTRTQVGVALSLAWQGQQYPLLLVGVDLVPVLSVEWHPRVVRPALTPPHVSTMDISNTEDGSWRCSFARTEAYVVGGQREEERWIFLVAKTLVALLRAEPCMSREIKGFYTWWCDRQYKLPVPKDFCLKNSFLRLLEKKRGQNISWKEKDTLYWVTQVFRQMCNLPDALCADLCTGKSYAYFGGDCEGPNTGEGAPLIICFLESVVSGTPGE